MRSLPSFLVLLLAFFAVVFSAGWYVGSNNVQSPAGYAAYVISRPVFGKASFSEVLVGPSSTGRSWRLYGDLVSLTPYSYPENFDGDAKLIARDKLAINGNAHVVWRLRSGIDNIRTYMEKFGGLDEAHSPDESARSAYANYIKEPLRTLVREEFSKYNGLDVTSNLAEMGRNIQKELTSSLAATPFEVLQVVIGNANPPAVVLEQIALKVAKTQEDERKATELSIAQKNLEIEKANGAAEGERALAVATKRAEANRVLGASITPVLLQYQAIENMKGAQKVYLQLGANGLPLVGTITTESGDGSSPLVEAKPASPPPVLK
jgi:regulator of protease activity HflC (stomatin/prohibitin superfamily)